MRVVVDRDSVAAGDDVASHRREFEVDDGLTIGRLLATVRPDAAIGGGRATWLVVVGPVPGTPGDAGRPRPIGVYAQEWGATRFFDPEHVPLSEFAGPDGTLSLHFGYLAQVDPELVVDRYRAGGSLTHDERTGLTEQRMAELAESDAVLAQQASPARYLSQQTTSALILFGCTIQVHSNRYFRCSLPTTEGPLTTVVQAQDTMAGIWINGAHLANFRPLVHAEQFVIAQLGDAWRRSSGRPPVSLPALPPDTPVAPVKQGNRWFFRWTRGQVRHDATFGIHQELAHGFARYAPITVSDLVTAYLR
jgi:hypothetical protein